MRQTSKCRKFLADDTWPRRALLWLVLGSICRIRNKWKVRHRARAGQKLSVMMLKTHKVTVYLLRGPASNTPSKAQIVPVPDFISETLAEILKLCIYVLNRLEHISEQSGILF